MGNIFVNHIFEKELESRIYKSDNSIIRQIIQIKMGIQKKGAEYFSKEDILTAKEHTERRSASFASREMKSEPQCGTTQAPGVDRGKRTQFQTLMTMQRNWNLAGCWGRENRLAGPQKAEHRVTKCPSESTPRCTSKRNENTSRQKPV